MRFALALSLAISCAPALAAAQDCFDCVLGIWDDPALTQNRGRISPGEPKEVYVGIKLAGADRVTAGVEFSVSGLDQGGLYLLGATPLGSRAVVFGTVPAPEDTSVTSTGIGGATVAWSQCLEGDVALLKLVLYSVDLIADRMIEVKRSYPPTNPDWGTPIRLHCDAPAYTASRVTGGCYVLNPSGPATSCQSLKLVGVETATWSGIKTLYR
jgi:hypothetical protein